MPKVDIVTVNLNNAFGLKRTMESVFSQTFTDYNYIIIDGGSTDGSIEIIQKNFGKLHYSVSEKDNGIYNAMNKGIDLATGQYLFFLNSGDRFYQADTLEKVVPHLQNNELVYGNIQINETGKKWIKFYNEKLDFEYFTKDTLPHQGTFIKSSLFRQIGLYDEGLKITADWKFFLQAICIYKVSALYIDQVISNYDYSGISSRPEYYSLQKHEKDKVLTELFPLHIESIRELHSLRDKKDFYDSFEKDFFVKKYFGAKLKWQSLKRKLKK